MAKVSGYRMGIFWLAGALFLLGSTVSAQYRLQITSPDKDSVFLRQTLGLVASFPGKPACNDYVSKLPALLMSKGYPAASVGPWPSGSPTPTGSPRARATIP